MTEAGHQIDVSSDCGSTNQVVYCEMINLERDRDRRDHMEAELDRAGVQAHFFPGFDYQVDDKEEMYRQCLPEGPWGVFHLQNMACTISHARALERFLKTDADLCLILEDDVLIAPDLGQWILDMSWWPKDAGIVKIERWPGARTRVLMDAPVAHHRGRKVARMLSRHVGSAGYFITRPAAKSVLEDRPFDISIDNLLFNANASRVARKLEIYQVTPALVTQGNEPPDSAARGGTRLRPKGWPLLRQKIKRAYYEAAYPLTTIAKYLTGRATLENVLYAAHTALSNTGHEVAMTKTKNTPEGDARHGRID